VSIIQSAITTAIRLLPDKAPDPLIHADRSVGRSIARVDGPLKVRGRARFAAEVSLPDLSYAALVYATITRGSIDAIDTTLAEKAPGVLLVMTYKNAPRMPAPGLMMDDPKGAAGSSLPVMQDAAIHWNGEPVAIVVAESQEEADAAAALVSVTYIQEPAATSLDLHRQHAHAPDNILGEPAQLEIGRAERALADAAHVVDASYSTPRHNHAAMELHAVTVSWNKDRLTLHDATQMLNLTRSCLAAVFKIPETNVRVLSPFVGGGFGNKGLWNHQILAAAASRMLGRPVRLVLSREGVFRITGGRTFTEQRVALGADADGKLMSLIHTGLAGMTSHNNCPEQFTFPARHLYAAKNFFLSQKVVDLDMVANTFMRAPGESVGTFALESALDELAAAMELDPIEMRRRIEPIKDPTSGLSFSSRHLVQAYSEGAERFGWHQRNAVPRSRRQGEWLIGYGVATATYPYYRMPGGAASIRLTADGRAVVRMASHEMGMGTATAQAQHASERLGLPVEAVAFEHGDSDFPSGTLAGGSSQTASIIAAVTAAADALTVELLKLAGNDSPLAGLKPAEVEMRNQGLRQREKPENAESYASILARARRDDISVQAPAPAPLEMKKYSMHSYGAQFCEAWVSDRTGEVRIKRWLGSFDTGRIVNPKMAASQFRGGIIMGLGLALMEETQFDERTGRIMSRSLADYHVPVHMDVPEIEVIWTDIPDPHSPMGVHGIGEIGITGVGAAVANAVYNATGRRVRDLPITLDKLL
jgi:xanthine dehydrogenase YagR molybdenum-binding subunit